MQLDAVLAQRLATQGLTRPYDTVEDAVRSLLCVQSQDAPLARWSLAMRTGRTHDDDVSAAVDSGRVVRTHVLRPTWHYVHAADLRWLLALTSPKVVSALAARHRQLGLDDAAVVGREHRWLADTLRGGRHLTRRQLTRDDLRGERLGHLVMLAELDGLVCSGPLVGGQHTYALVDEWIPATPDKERDEAVRELVLRFFAGHGPASVAHLVRWTTLTKREVTAAVADLGEALESAEVESQTLVWAAGTRDVGVSAGTRLVPVFDEAHLTYPGSTFPRVPDHPWGDRAHAFSEAGGGLVVSDLRDVGWWKRREDGRTTRVTVGLAPSLGAAARRQVEEQAAALAAYTGRTLELVLQT
ncbi:winged helix DNA-binding domain-containing protein [uncultured Nocardioides sp.]|uniref:winged helix DNA-binding domain-containing protein n=1 Tax=uncultured Nocardioides sp. TaxID=198441 RepID=UPI0025DD169E|nr:winged helix DNA-binding domain-containing protein [uncultured Nocardioides sp.]